jgi:acetolactate synthase-1/2/3 large subunit
VRKPGRELGFTAFDEMAQALGAHGEKVEDPNEIRPALERAFASGKAAVINVIVEPTASGVSRAWGGSRME